LTFVNNKALLLLLLMQRTDAAVLSQFAKAAGGCQAQVTCCTMSFSEMSKQRYSSFHLVNSGHVSRSCLYSFDDWPTATSHAAQRRNSQNSPQTCVWESWYTVPEMH